jgi:hypothetical protein
MTDSRTMERGIQEKPEIHNQLKFGDIPIER